MKATAAKLTDLSNFNLLKLAFLGLMMAMITSLVIYPLPSAYGASSSSIVTVENDVPGQHSDHTSGGLHQDCSSQVHCQMQAIVGSPTLFASEAIPLRTPLFHDAVVNRAYPPVSPPPKII
jgi:hypothetical protein